MRNIVKTSRALASVIAPAPWCPTGDVFCSTSRLNSNRVSVREQKYGKGCAPLTSYCWCAPLPKRPRAAASVAMTLVVVPNLIVDGVGDVTVGGLVVGDVHLVAGVDPIEQVHVGVGGERLRLPAVLVDESDA